ncbi:PQQ-dependent sugar dehydrogenase [Microbacterium sp. ARD31]|jgi:glucose/arabinose dehydrogenase/mono/diheme cytochrome c family protein|nr:PQQ-dependent sugar dehydrogenase [Microbacterium sp. ARD31]MDT0187976.1 PQQ-dependent sugar dehydrogenase [Microbacterium sp. ARD31]MDV2987906.1 PQQ-dependent sugar dehydrogenase [Methylobacteriaceae bacterium AG10]
MKLRSKLHRAAYTALLASGALATGAGLRAAAQQPARDSVTLPPGFSATVFADGLGHARHIAVAPNGVVYANTWSGPYYKNKPDDGGFLYALKDNDGDGKADVVERFGGTTKTGSAGGTGLEIHDGKLYAEMDDKIVRFTLPTDRIAPMGDPEVIVSGIPSTGDHPMHPFTIGKDGGLYIGVGSATNSCQPKNRMTGIKGADPCVELETRAGVWRYDANKAGQTFSPKERYATGLRNGEGLSFDADGRLFATQHGRDQLAESWGKLYTAKQAAELPSEEVVEVKKGSDFGWPYCYYDPTQKKLVLAPEYGGDGGKEIGVCAGKQGPVAAFPAHWAPNDMEIYLSDLFPKAYQGGAFIAFHGSWNRAPAPQDGFNVVFQPLKDGKADGDYVIFADGFAGRIKEPGRAAHRPSGLTIGPDGTLYIADDQAGRIWKVTYAGDRSAKIEAAPRVTVAVGSAAMTPPPEGMDPNAGVTLPTPPGGNPEQVVLGGRIFRGEEAGGTCAGCHGGDAGGGPIGPSLTAGEWDWSDGSLAGLKKTILDGVPEPKKHPGAMPPMGGVELTGAQVDALAAYVWAIGHQKN